MLAYNSNTREIPGVKLNCSLHFRQNNTFSHSNTMHVHVVHSQVLQQYTMDHEYTHNVCGRINSALPYYTCVYFCVCLQTLARRVDRTSDRLAVNNHEYACISGKPKILEMTSDYINSRWRWQDRLDVFFRVAR